MRLGFLSIFIGHLPLKKHLLALLCCTDQKYNPKNSQKMLPVMDLTGRNKRFQRGGGESLLPAQPLLNAQACDRSMLLADWACIQSAASHCRTYRTVWMAFSVWQTPFRELPALARFSKGKLMGVKHIYSWANQQHKQSRCFVPRAVAVPGS